MKKFNEWNELTQTLNKKENIINFKEREIYWGSLGENIGSEQNGKGKDFSRPILVVKKLNKQLFFSVPLSTTIRDGSYFYNFNFFENQQSSALLVQAKIFDLKRIDQKIGMINKNDFLKLKEKLRVLLDL
ncbi:MAG TPA: type II toxin-antitoxin system PemK/MazF family toxin [Arcobacter sp.]|nr:type II toxin-antitoxin system PemK/MazF family toxin [Arcobacter sp.]